MRFERKLSRHREKYNISRNKRPPSWGRCSVHSLSCRLPAPHPFLIVSAVCSTPLSLCVVCLLHTPFSLCRLPAPHPFLTVSATCSTPLSHCVCYLLHTPFSLCLLPAPHPFLFVSSACSTPLSHCVCYLLHTPFSLSATCSTPLSHCLLPASHPFLIVSAACSTPLSLCVCCLLHTPFSLCLLPAPHPFLFVSAACSTPLSLCVCCLLHAPFSVLSAHSTPLSQFCLPTPHPFLSVCCLLHTPFSLSQSLLSFLRSLSPHSSFCLSLSATQGVSVCLPVWLSLSLSPQSSLCLYQTCLHLHTRACTHTCMHTFYWLIHGLMQSESVLAHFCRHRTTQDIWIDNDFSACKCDQYWHWGSDFTVHTWWLIVCQWLQCPHMIKTDVSGCSAHTW